MSLQNDIRSDEGQGATVLGVSGKTKDQNRDEWRLCGRLQKDVKVRTETIGGSCGYRNERPNFVKFLG